MAKKFVRTTKSVWDAKTDKSQYNDSIVFIEDSKQIWSNGITYITPKLGGVNLLSNSLPNNLGNWSGDGANVTYSNGAIRGVVSGNYPRIKNFDLAGITFEIGAEYTISFTARSSIAANRSVQVVTNTGSDLTFNFGAFPVTTSWKRYSLTATAQNSGSTASAYGLYIYCGDTKNSSSGQWLEIKEVKLEKGNIVTDWTPTLDELQSNGSSGESTDTKNTVGSTYDQLGNSLFLVGVHGDEAHNQSYAQSYITGTGAAGPAQRRCGIEGNEAHTVFNVPIINCDTLQCSNGITATKFSTTSAIGSSTVPVYINSSGVPTPCSLPTTVSCTSTTSNSTYYIPFVNGYTTASRSMCTDSGITYNPSTNVLTATTFSGNLKGNADTATVADVNPIINMQHFDLEGAIAAGSSGVNLYIRDSQSGAAATTGYPNNNWSYGGHGPIQHNIYIDLGDLNGGNSIVPQVQFVIANFDRGLDVWHNITYKATATVGSKFAWLYINCPNQGYKVFYKIKRIDNSTTPDIVNPANDTSLSLSTGQSHGVKLLTGLAKGISTTYPQIKRIPLPLLFNGNISTYQEGFAVNTQCFQVKISRNYCENNTCVSNRITVEVVQVI